jgi:hypothetical protein
MFYVNFKLFLNYMSNARHDDPFNIGHNVCPLLWLLGCGFRNQWPKITGLHCRQNGSKCEKMILWLNEDRLPVRNLKEIRLKLIRLIANNQNQFYEQLRSCARIFMVKDKLQSGQCQVYKKEHKNSY